MGLLVLPAWYNSLEKKGANGTAWKTTGWQQGVFRAKFILVILIIKVKEMHYFSTSFGKEIYMFWTDLLSIIAVLTATGICHTEIIYIYIYIYIYIRHNKPQSAYALHILNNKHEYGPINNTMILLKHINKTSLLLPYKQLYIHSYHKHKQLISEQYINEHNPIYQLIHNTFNMSLPMRPTEQSINTIKPVPSRPH